MNVGAMRAPETILEADASVEARDEGESRGVWLGALLLSLVGDARGRRDHEVPGLAGRAGGLRAAHWPGEVQDHVRVWLSDPA